MAVGYTVDKQSLDTKAADAVIAVRRAFVQVEIVQSYLVNNPVRVVDGAPNVDPLVDMFGYSEDDAYLVRLVMGDLDYLQDNIKTIMRNGRKLTGLQ